MKSPLRKLLAGRVVGALAISVLLTASLAIPTNATEALTVSGTITLPPGIQAQNLTVYAGIYSTATPNENGEFELKVPKNVDVSFIFDGLFYSDEREPLDRTYTSANWRTTIKFAESGVLNFTVPQPKQVLMTFFDASNNPLQYVEINDENYRGMSMVQDGRQWTGHQNFRALDSSGVPRRLVTSTGSFSVWIFPLTDKTWNNRHGGFRYQGVTVSVQGGTAGVRTPYEQTAKIDVSQNQSLKLCVPFNFGNSFAMPADCYKTAKQENEELANPNPTPKAQKFRNCSAMQRVFSGGVAKSVNTRNKGARIRQTPVVNAAIFELNKNLDRDKDGIACER